MSEEPYYANESFNSAWLAAHLRVTRSAVSNWLSRGALPEDLRPTYIHGTPYWELDKIAAIEEWHAKRPRRRKLTAAPLADWQLRQEWQDAVDFAFAEGKSKPLLAMARLITAGDKLLGEEDSA